MERRPCGTYYLSQELLDEITVISKAMGISKSTLVKLAVGEYVRKMRKEMLKAGVLKDAKT